MTSIAFHTVSTFSDINSGLARGFELITQALQLEPNNPSLAQDSMQAASAHLQKVVKRPGFATYASSALHVFDERFSNTDQFDLNYRSKIDWSTIEANNNTKARCLLQIARKHPDPNEQHRALEILREKLIRYCREVGTLNNVEVDSLMLVIDMINDTNGLTEPELKQLVKQFVDKQKKQQASRTKIPN